MGSESRATHTIAISIYKKNIEIVLCIYVCVHVYLFILLYGSRSILEWNSKCKLGTFNDSSRMKKSVRWKNDYGILDGR
jgi:hypothetical protein